MKKTLLALALFGAVAGTASAASVTLYGTVDVGFGMTSVAGDHNARYQDMSDTTFTLDSGNNSASKFGLKGVEELGNGMVVGFQLENGFSADDGKLGNDDRLFGREARLFLQTDFGTFSFGRMGTLVSDNGTYGILADLSPMGSGWGSIIGNQNLVFASNAGRVDNAVVYESPDLYGAKVYAQYSFKADNTAKLTDPVTGVETAGEEGKSSADRYAAIAATYKVGSLGFIGAFDYTDEGVVAAGLDGVRGKDQMTFTLGANYDCGFATTYLAAQYFKDANWVGGGLSNEDFGVELANGVSGVSYGDIDGYGIVLGTKFPVLGGTAYGMAGYMDADSDRANKEVTRWTVGGGYEYALSKRTAVYGGAAWFEDTVDNTNPSVAQVVAGVKHSF